MIAVTVFDVGQASSVLIDFGSDVLGIIDCGTSEFNENPVAGEVRRRILNNRETRIAFVMLSHLDWDHISGLLELLEDSEIRERIGRFYCNDIELRTLFQLISRSLRPGSGVTENPITLRRIRTLRSLNQFFLNDAKAQGGIHRELSSPPGADHSQYPVHLNMEDLGVKVCFRLWSPSQGLRDRASAMFRELAEPGMDNSTLLGSLLENRADWNAASAVLTLDYSGKRLLFSGDANVYTWIEIDKHKNGQSQLKSDVTIGWHHGARLGVRSGESYDQKVWGEVLSVGDPGRERGVVLFSHGSGHYGHPHADTVKAVLNLGGSILCTQLRQRAEKIPLEDLADLGALLELAGSEAPDCVRRQGNTCSGDITINITDTGEISVLCKGPRQEGGAPQPGCCLHGPLA